MRVYVFDMDALWRPIREEEAEIKMCKKTIWAVLPSGKRKLMGASAFLTLPSAERSHRAMLARTVVQLEQYSRKRFKLNASYAYGAMKNRLLTYH